MKHRSVSKVRSTTIKKVIRRNKRSNKPSDYSVNLSTIHSAITKANPVFQGGWNSIQQGTYIKNIHGKLK